MTSLSKATSLTRRFLIGAGLTLLCLVLIAVVINLGAAVKNLFFPSPLPAPTAAFGKLPSIDFPKNTSSTDVTYTLNTLTGTLPTLPDRAAVYKIEEPQPNILALQNAEKKVSQVSFLSQPTAISDVIYRFTNSDPLPKTLDMNILSFDFSLTSSYATNKTVTDANNLPDENTAISFAQNFLSNMSLTPTDLDSSKTKASLFSLSGNALVPADSLSNSQIIRIDFFQKDINKMPIFYTNPGESPMNFLIASTDLPQPQIVTAHFMHKTFTGDNATYAIISPSQAFDMLKDGKAYVANPTGQTITIRNVSLGYFVSDLPQKYLMPIIVFQGDNGFSAYVSAVTDAWIQK